MQGLSEPLKKPVTLSQNFDHLDFERAEEWLQNWRRWARVTLPRYHCRSIEHRYKSPQCWYPQEPMMPIDIALAERIEDIWRGLPHKYKKLLKMAYIANRPEWFIRRRLRIGEYEIEVLHAKRLILERV